MVQQEEQINVAAMPAHQRKRVREPSPKNLFFFLVGFYRVNICKKSTVTLIYLP
jgi:hypothetical protein